MQFLIDTNIIIKLETQDVSTAERDAAAAMEANRLISRGDHSLLIHPATAYDIQRDTDQSRANRTRLVLGKYNELREPPSSDLFLSELGPSDYGSGDWVDNQLIAAVATGVVDYLVTEDRRLLRKLARVAPVERGLTINGALELLQSLYDDDVRPPVAVDLTVMHTLDLADPIWDTFRQDYPRFDDWFRAKQGEQRPAWIVKPDDRLQAVAIGKREEDGPYGLAGQVLKVCSFKVSEDHEGSKYGELLLKSVLGHAFGNDYDSMYMTVFESHADLIALIEDFGFVELDALTGLGENVYSKRLRARTSDLDLDPLDYQKSLGPPAIHPATDRFFAVPIEPVYYQALFPGHGDQLELPGFATRTRAYGNAIKKAYISLSPSRMLTPGDALLFYRSRDVQAITDVGVVEQTLVSDDAGSIASFVGARTVYTIAEIEAMTSRGSVLAILFRHDRMLQDDLVLTELVERNALQAAPQSITSIGDGGIEWLKNQFLG